MIRNFIPLLALSLFGAVCLPAQAAAPKVIVAVFSQSDAQFSETITLYADGSYQQAETEKKTHLYGPHSSQIPLPSDPDPLGVFGNGKRSGAWRVLDKENGQPLVFKTLAALPKDAVVTLTGVMPFGITWERQPPFQSHGTRTLPAGDFQPAPSAKK
jgi:hypothetical protein